MGHQMREFVRGRIVAGLLLHGALFFGALAGAVERAPDNPSDERADILVAREVLDDPVRNRDPVLHLRACGQLAAAEWSAQTRLLRRVAAQQPEKRLDGHDIAVLAGREPRLQAELLQQSEPWVRAWPERYTEWLERLEHSRWRRMPFAGRALAARWYLLREENTGQADYLAIRLITGIDPETRSPYYHEHCQ